MLADRLLRAGQAVRNIVSLPRRLAAEFLGSALLLAIVVGSGIMGERLAAGNAALALLLNAIATGTGLIVLISVFGPLSGAHFNPAVSALFWARGELSWRAFLAYLPVQLAGAIGGVLLAHVMFDLPLLQLSEHARHGSGQWTGEFVATAGLMLSILGSLATRPAWTPLLVAAWIVAGYAFTSSTSFANPAVTFARSLSDTFAGIAPADVPGFVIAQLAGTAAGGLLGTWLWPSPSATSITAVSP
ncbi:MIP/aquaporin family protein [uncultured Nevskia sp.]|uniref:aquaporin n=1 Tax=uncultured Nevskia sp. TaxID=228950 RepID=UPI0025DF2F62|nr:MIP/aquaporin family protein [uncultured Nevskia sp.]